MLRSAGRWDWYEIPVEWVQRWATTTGGPVPGVVIRPKGTIEIHRTHLPLLRAAGFDVSNVGDQPVESPPTYGDVELRPWQVTGRAWLTPRRGAIVADEMRLGKGQPLSARVLTPSGWTTMGALCVGDEVIDPDGGIGVVSGVYPQGIKRVYRLTTTDGAVTECDEDHLWFTWTSVMQNRGNPGRVLSVRQLLAAGLGAVFGGKPCAKWILPLTVPVELPVRALPIDPYVLGLLLGDGSFRPSGSVGFSSADALLIARVRGEVERLGGSLRYSGSYDWRIQGRPNRVLDFVKRVGLHRRYSYEKFIPPDYFLGSVDQRRALLAGLLDTDGYAGPVTQFSTSSDQLRDGVIDLVRSLGGLAWYATKASPSYRHRGERRQGRPSFTLTICLDENPFRLPRKVQAWQGRGQRRRKIASIEFDREEATQCIAVTTKRNLYLTDGFIVTHNTTLALTMHDASTGPLMILAPLDVRRVWLRWVERLWPGASVYCLEGHAIDPDALRAADVVFGHYDIVIKHRLVSFRPGTLIVDEAHLLANKKSKRTEGVRFFSGQAHRVLVLTGTPLWNHVKGLWPLLAMTAPGAWGKDHAFKQRYCQPVMGEYGWRYDGVSNEEEWYLRRQEAVLARTWASERPDLPPPLYRRIDVPIDRVLTEALDDAAAALSSASEQTITTINRYRQMLGRVKAQEAVRRALRRSECVVVWSWHRTVADFIAAEVRKHDRPAFVIHGKEPVEKRLDAIDEWARTPGAILSATLAVGQVGHDFSAAPYAVIAELDWTPVVLSQAAMRIFDPTRGMEVDILGADHPVDSLLVDRVITKLKRSQITQMAAADSGFHMHEEVVDRGDLLANLDEIVTRSHAKFDRSLTDFTGGA